MKRRAVIAIAVALLLLGIFVVAVGWDDVLGAIERASLPVYALAFVGTIGCYGLRCVVWERILTVVDKHRPYWLISGVFLTATFTKYVTPYGQVTSGVGVAALISRYTDAAYEESLATVVSADFLNYLPYYTFGLVGLGYVLGFRPGSLEIGSQALPLLGVVGLVGLVVAFGWQRRTLVVTAIARLAGIIRKPVALISESAADKLRRENVRARLQGFYTTLDLVSKDRPTMIVALICAHLAWLGLATALYVTAIALGSPVPFGVAVLVVAVSKVGFVVPTPGGIGGVEATIAGALTLLTPMSVALATATAILFRFSTYWFVVFVGGGTSVALTLKDPLPPGERN